MAPATKPAAAKSGGPQRSIKSFFTSSPAKVSAEPSLSGKKEEALASPAGKMKEEALASPGGKKKKEALASPGGGKKKALVIGPDVVAAAGKKDVIDVESVGGEKAGIPCSPGKRKVGHGVSSPLGASSKKQKVVISLESVEEGDGEEEVTPVKRRRLRKVKEDSNSGFVGVVASSRGRRGSVSRPGEDLEAVIGRRLRVYWPLDKAWYAGIVEAYNASEETHLVRYDDGEKQDVDILREKVEWLSGAEEMDSGADAKRPKRSRSEAVNSDSPASKVTVVEEEEKGDAPRRGRARRQIKCVVESDEDTGDDDDEDDADFHADGDISEEKESELDDEEEDEVEDEEPDEPEEESDSDGKARRKSKKTPSSAVKKPSARGSKKLSTPASGASVGSAFMKGSSLAKNLSGRIAFNSGRLESVKSISNGFASSEYGMLLHTGELSFFFFSIVERA